MCLTLYEGNELFYCSSVFDCFFFGVAFGGQALVLSSKDFYDRAALVAVVDVKEVTKVEISTGEEGQTSDVYVAKAELQQTLKPDFSPTSKKRTIAIVGSTIPMSSAVWRPIKTTRYLVFLNREQGHYRFGEKYAMRPISPEGKVEWIEENAQGVWEHSSIDIEVAIKKIKAEQSKAE